MAEQFDCEDRKSGQIAGGYWTKSSTGGVEVFVVWEICFG